MKKQLLFTFVLFATILIASAQTNTITFDNSGSDAQVFTVGQQTEDDLNDVNIVAVGGSGLVLSNNKFFGIGAPDITDNNATGTFTFIVTTDSATPISTPLTLDMAKRPGCSVAGNVSVSGGYTDTSFSYESNGTDVAAVQPIVIEFGSLISLQSGSPLTITITLDEMLNIDNVNTPIFRLENVLLEKNGTLGIGEIDTQEVKITTFPNPVVNSFQIDANIHNIESVQVYNTNGQLLKTFSKEVNYDISDLATGIYIANIKAQTGSKIVRIAKK